MYFISFQDVFDKPMLILSTNKKGLLLTVKHFNIRFTRKFSIDNSPKTGLLDIKKTPKSNINIKLSFKKNHSDIV